MYSSTNKSHKSVAARTDSRSSHRDKSTNMPLAPWPLGMSHYSGDQIHRWPGQDGKRLWQAVPFGSYLIQARISGNDSLEQIA
jgi:hypothetical protein